MRCGESVAPGERDHYAPAVRIEACFSEAHFAPGQVSDDSFPHSGSRIIEARQPERFGDFVQHGAAGHDNFGAAGTNPGDCAPFF